MILMRGTETNTIDDCDADAGREEPGWYGQPVIRQELDSSLPSNVEAQEDDCSAEDGEDNSESPGFAARWRADHDLPSSTVLRS